MLTLSLASINISCLAQVEKREGNERLHERKNELLLPPKYTAAPPASFIVPTYTNNLIQKKYACIQFDASNPSSVAVIQSKDSPGVISRWYEQTLASSGWQIVRKFSQDDISLQGKTLSSEKPGVEACMLLAKKNRKNLILNSYREKDAGFSTSMINISNERSGELK